MRHSWYSTFLAINPLATFPRLRIESDTNQNGRNGKRTQRENTLNLEFIVENSTTLTESTFCDCIFNRVIGKFDFDQTARAMRRETQGSKLHAWNNRTDVIFTVGGHEISN